MDKKIYVLTANYPYFKEWCKRNGFNPRDHNVIYASRPEVLLGVSGKDAEFVKYYADQHPQYREIMENVRIIQSLQNR